MRNSVIRISVFCAMSVLLASGAISAWAASTEADYKAAYSAAETANNEAGKLRNQWTTTVSALKDAKKAAEGGDFDKAVALSKHAEALAKASIFQSTEQKDAWKAMEIK
ncbi:MAG: hypothetical protein JSS22_20735 [Proteobacteria bacterium]|nr:hypothetical protein [Pseudomonadota bacterium]